jgi:hypothetical protein
MNDIRVYSIWAYKKQILHDNYYQIIAHEVCDDSISIVISMVKKCFFPISFFLQLNFQTFFL